MDNNLQDEGKIVAVCRSANKGERKKDIEEALLIEEYGMDKDAHSGDWHRQVSLLALESISTMREKGLNVHPGDFAENITTSGLMLISLPIGQKLQLGDDVVLEVTQLGKECHERCAIYYQAGDCVMPREGIFARVIKGGMVRNGDPVRLISS